MQKHGLVQEELKLIACVTMLLDHIGVVVVMGYFNRAAGANRGMLLDLYEILRMIGRLAFPIYCFLLAEGSFYTKNPKHYGFRLLIAALLSEIPYDLAVCGGFTWQHQSVMVTLFLGFLMLEGMKRSSRLLLRLLLIVPFAYLAQWMNTDYGADGILVIALFALTRELPHRAVWHFFGLWCIFSPSHLMALNWLGKFSVTTQELAVLAAVPIALYNGRKTTKSKLLQWAFYLFYPAHLVVLYLIGRL